MARTDYKSLIEYRIKSINETFGTSYRADYCAHYGGWNLYIRDEKTGGHSRGHLGFDLRKSSAEMLAYLDGIAQGIWFYKNII